MGGYIQNVLVGKTFQLYILEEITVLDTQPTKAINRCNLYYIRATPIFFCS